MGEMHRFTSFGPALKFHRKQARLTQDDLGRQVGYSREYIAYLESGKRKPDPNVIASLFIPALKLIPAPEAASRLIELAAQSRGKLAGDFGITIAYERTVTTLVETQIEETVEATPALPDNLHQAMDWYVQMNPEAALALANAMGPFWRANGQFTEARTWLLNILSKSTSPTVSRGHALMHAADFARHQGDVHEAVALFDEAQRVFEANGDLAGVCEALHQQAWAYFDTNHNRAEALAALKQSLVMARQIDNKTRISAALVALAHMEMAGAIAAGETGPIAAMLDEALACAQAAGAADRFGFIHQQHALLEMSCGHITEAHRLFLQAADAFERAGDKYSLAWSRAGEGECKLLLGELEKARHCFEAGLATFEAMGGHEGRLILTHHLARVDLMEGKLAAAADGFLRTLEVSEQSNYPQMLARSIAGLGGVAARMGNPRLGAQLLGAADGMIAQLAPFLYPSDAQEYAKFAGEARVALGDAAFDAAWQQGRALNKDEAKAIAGSLAPRRQFKVIAAR